MVANRQPSPKQGTIQDLINGLLDRGYNNTAQPVLNAVARSVNSGLIQQRLKELDAEVARLMEAGETLKPDNPVLRALLADLDDTMKVNARVVDGGAPHVQQTGADAAARIQRQLALPGMTDTQLRAIGIVWNKPDPEAVARLINYTQGQAWTDMLSKYGANVVDTVRNQAIMGIAYGWSPLRTASNVRAITENMPGYTANTLMRTLQLTSYRDATAASQNANADLASRVILIEALDDRTCLACIDRHGQVIWDSEEDAGTPIPRVDDHWNGRGTSVMEVKGRPLDIQTGRDWFNNLPPERQQQQGTFADSPAAWEAFKTGQVTLSDFVHVYDDPLFGQMVRESSLTDALAGNNNNPFAESDGKATAQNDLIAEDALRSFNGVPSDIESLSETWATNLTPEQSKAVEYWSQNGFREYRALGKGANLSAFATGRRTYPDFLSALESAPSYNGVLYRGLSLDGDTQVIFDNWQNQVGTTISFDTFSSASISPDVAGSFTRGQYDTKLVFEIYDGNGKYINVALPRHGTRDDEYEAIIMPNSNFTVLNVFNGQVDSFDGPQDTIIVQLRGE